MAIVNPLLNVKDSRWLQLEVCREYQRNKCTRPDSECKFAHPAVNVEVQNGRVIACYDSIKVLCLIKPNLSFFPFWLRSLHVLVYGCFDDDLDDDWLLIPFRS